MKSNIVPELSKMHQDIHIKSLKYTLKENKIKVKSTIKKLMVCALLTCVILFFLAFIYRNNWYAIILISFSIYMSYLTYTINNLCQKHKKIKQKLKTLQQ